MGLDMLVRLRLAVLRPAERSWGSRTSRSLINLSELKELAQRSAPVNRDAQARHEAREDREDDRHRGLPVARRTASAVLLTRLACVCDAVPEKVKVATATERSCVSKTEQTEQARRECRC